MTRSALPPAVRDGRHQDIDAVRAIEQRAACRFAEVGLAEIATWPVTGADVHASAIDDGRLFVVADDGGDGAPIGFALVEEYPGAVHLRELDVLPERSGRGLGTRLLDHACAWGRERGHRLLTLTTFRDVPFNAPFYARYGFRILDDPPLWLAALRRAERSAGTDIVPRVAMGIDL